MMVLKGSVGPYFLKEISISERLSWRQILMVVTKNIVVVGDGAAGIMTANKLRYLTSEKDAKVTLIGNNVKNFCRSDGPQIALRMKKFTESGKNLQCKDP